MARKKKEETKAISSYIDVYGGGGYSALLHSIDGTSVPGGGAGMLGFGYFMKHKSQFNFRAGLEMMYLNSSTLLNTLHYQGDYLYSDAILSDHNMLYNMDYFSLYVKS